MKNPNIAAISTPPGKGGVAIIRISGGDPLSIAEKMFVPAGKTAVAAFSPNHMYPGEIDAGDFKDYGLCVYFRAPKSFTGEGQASRAAFCGALSNWARRARSAANSPSARS